MSPRSLHPLLVFGLALPAQEATAVVPFEGICERLELAHAAMPRTTPSVPGKPPVPDKQRETAAEFLADQAFKELIAAWIQSDEALAQARRRSIVQFTPNRAMLLIAADQRVVDAATAAAEQLQRDELQEHAVLCTVVRLPGAVATAHGLLPGKARSVDEAAAGKVLKAAVGNGGTLHNLPEARGLPLIPFALGALPRTGEKVAEPATDQADIRCVALPIGSAKALLQVSAPGSKPQFLQVPAGQGALLRLGVPARRVGEGERPQREEEASTHVLWLRYVGSEPHVPRPLEPKAPARPSPAPSGRDQKGMSP